MSFCTLGQFHRIATIGNGSDVLAFDQLLAITNTHHLIEKNHLYSKQLFAS